MPQTQPDLKTQPLFYILDIRKIIHNKPKIEKLERLFKVEKKEINFFKLPEKTFFKDTFKETISKLKALNTKSDEIEKIIFLMEALNE